MTQARFPSLVGLRLRAFGSKPPSEFLYFNLHQFILKNLTYFGSDRSISDLIGLFRRDVTN